MLTKFRLVNCEKIKALHIKGDTIPLDRIDDALAEKLIGKTHVLERVADVAPASVAVAVAEAAPAEEAPATSSRRKN